MTQTNNIPESIRKYFKKPIEIELYASTLGINKDDWTKVNVNSDKNDAAKIMIGNSFDILPIIGHNCKYEKYWGTDIWGDFSSINPKQKEIGSNSIYYLTSFRDLIIKFIDEENNFYFLNDHKDIVGLITIAHFNSDEVYLFLYQLLSKLERQLGGLLKYHDVNEVISIIKRNGTWNDCRLKVYDGQVKNSVERFWWEYISINDLKVLIKEYSLQEKCGYKTKDHFNSDFKKLINERHKLAHPMNNLITNKESLNEINDFINISERIISELNHEIKL